MGNRHEREMGEEIGEGYGRSVAPAARLRQTTDEDVRCDARRAVGGYARVAVAFAEAAAVGADDERHMAERGRG